MALEALTNDPVRGGWLRGPLPFGVDTNTTLVAEAVSAIWSYLQTHGAERIVAEAQLHGEVLELEAVPSAIAALQVAVARVIDPPSMLATELRSDVTEPMQCDGSAGRNQKLEWETPTPPKLTLSSCVRFTTVPTAYVYAASKGRKRKKGGRKQTYLKIGGIKKLIVASPTLVPALQFLEGRYKLSAGGRGFVVGALPQADDFSKLALAQSLFKYGAISVHTRDMDTKHGLSAADTMCVGLLGEGKMDL